MEETEPFFSGEDRNMMAMSKRRRLARVLRTRSVREASSCLHNTALMHTQQNQSRRIVSMHSICKRT